MLTNIRRKLSLLAVFTSVALTAVSITGFAQEEAERPALLFMETWQQSESALGRPMSSHASDNDYYLAGQNAVSSNDLELGLYGYRAEDITVYEHEGRIDLWTGLAGSPVAVTLKIPTWIYGSKRTCKNAGNRSHKQSACTSPGYQTC